jgi:hypothetical protein
VIPFANCTYDYRGYKAMSTEFETAKLYGLENHESLSCTTPEEAIVQAFEFADDAEITSITIVGYNPMFVSDRWICGIAARLAEWFGEQWDEDFAASAEEPTYDIAPLRSALVTLLTEHARSHETYDCEQCGRREYSEAEVRAIIARERGEKGGDHE